MKKISLILLFFLLQMGVVKAPARAQDGLPPLPGQTRQICGEIVSQIPFKMYGSVITDSAGIREGTDVRHKSTFAIAPQERLKICSSGPFFEGERVELTLKTMFPVFSCRTKIDREIRLSATPKKEGGYTYSATCF